MHLWCMLRIRLTTLSDKRGLPVRCKRNKCSSSFINSLRNVTVLLLILSLVYSVRVVTTMVIIILVPLHPLEPVAREQAAELTTSPADGGGSLAQPSFKSLRFTVLVIYFTYELILSTWGLIMGLRGSLAWGWIYTLFGLSPSSVPLCFLLVFPVPGCLACAGGGAPVSLSTAL